MADELLDVTDWSLLAELQSDARNARNMRHLERVTGRIAGLGSVTTTVVYSTPLACRSLTAASLGDTTP